MHEYGVFQSALEDLNQINNGDFQTILRSSVFQKNKYEDFDENITNYWTKYVETCIPSCDTTDLKVEFVRSGITCLLSFVQQNWTGPAKTLKPVLPGLRYDDESALQKQRTIILQELVEDGESLVSIVESPEFLHFALVILRYSYQNFSDLEIAKIWYSRCLFIHQQILEEHSVKIFNKLTKVIDELKELITDEENDDLRLEFSRIYLYYRHVQKSKEEMEIATKHSGLQTSLIGVLGKRTKFQEMDLPQLTFKIDINTSDVKDESGVCDSPVDVSLDDEVRLNKIEYANKPDGECPELTSLQQAVLLGILVYTQKSQPKDGLADEELESIIRCILDKPKIWSLKLSTLLIRSKLESNHKRTVMRAMMQVESLVECLTKPEPSIQDRLKYFFVSYAPPKWVLKSTLANILISVGSVKSALDIFISLEDWENVIHCYNALQLRHKAQEIIEQEIQKNSTPKLWCLLGDATDDIGCYQKAWEISNGRSARAQRHWAYFLYQRKEYGASIEHFQKSLEINSLQINLWFNLGYAALAEEKWEISAQAYRTYCSLEPESFEAWNNLARCYCELKQKRRAWRALKEALKIDYSNWRIWDNYMLVSSDLKEFDETVRSYHQILNLKEKHVDIPVLKSLVCGLSELSDLSGKLEDNEGETEIPSDYVNKLREKLLTLFGRLTSQVLNDAELWYLYSEVPPTDSAANLTKKHQLLLKAHRSAVNKQGWEKDLESCKKVIEIVSKLIDVSLTLQEKSALTSCKMAASGTIIQIKKEFPGNDVCDAVEEKFNKLKELMDS